MDERILVVPRGALDSRLGGERAGVPASSWEEAAHLLGLAQGRWMARGAAEGDFSVKQVIPYVVLVSPDGRVLAYPRQGRERRLHQRWSVGVGGHVEEADGAPGLAWPELLRRAARREAQEECPCRWMGELQVRGVISEEQTEVGRVHVGVCCRLVIDPATAAAGDGELAGWRWVAPAEPWAGLPDGARLETWSELALALFAAGEGAV